MSADFKIISAGSNGQPVTFNWVVIDHCNWDCTYCNAREIMKEQLFKNGKHQQSHELVLFKLKQLDFAFRIDLYGGEPTLHPELPSIIQRLQDIPNCQEIMLTTNFTESIAYYKQFDVPQSKLTIHISYHAEYSKKLVDKIIALDNAFEHTALFVEVMLHPKEQYYAQMLEMLTRLGSTNIKHGVNLVRDYDTPTNEFWDIFNPWLFSQDHEVSNIIPHETDQGTIYLNENEIIKKGIKYTGFRCQPLTYLIGLNGEISNMCTTKKMAIRASKEDFYKRVTCPVPTTCNCSQMFLYRKTSK